VELVADADADAGSKLSELPSVVVALGIVESESIFGSKRKKESFSC
jgi:hypothetical protein